VTSRRRVARIEIAGELPRVRLPLEIYPVSAGIKGGMAGSVAMAVLAMLYGLLSQRSIWYPINLLAAGFFPAASTASTEQLAAFHLDAFLIAAAIHLLTSLWWECSTAQRCRCCRGARFARRTRRAALLVGLLTTCARRHQSGASISGWTGCGSLRRRAVRIRCGRHRVSPTDASAPGNYLPFRHTAGNRKRPG
jgi:hypothetical protein